MPTFSWGGRRWNDFHAPTWKINDRFSKQRVSKFPSSLKSKVFLVTTDLPKTKKQPTSRCFWSPSIRQAFHSVLDSLSNADKKRFLMFVTGIEVKTSGFYIEVLPDFFSIMKRGWSPIVQIQVCVFFLPKTKTRPIAVAELLNWNKKNIAPILGDPTHNDVFVGSWGASRTGNGTTHSALDSKTNWWLFRFILETARCRTEVQMPFSAFTKDEHLRLHWENSEKRLRIWVDCWRWFLNQFFLHVKCVLPVEPESMDNMTFCCKCRVGWATKTWSRCSVISWMWCHSWWKLTSFVDSPVMSNKKMNVKNLLFF